ncbi:CsgE family curli-type amyloid fiber assembly protein [Chryseobacterium sp.]|uniref:CsgE family curli-type amyloid fiber assembly protein n=1 Tax=Chryseobacterium sp. TaxID=1871047 RepID=UPI003890398D
MKTYFSLAICICCLSTSFFVYAQNEVNINTKIEKQTLEKQIKLKAVVTNDGDTYQDLNYLFIAIKKGGTGNLSNNKQSGKFNVKSQEIKVLSEVNINLEDTDALKVYLYIRDEESNTLIRKDSLEIDQTVFRPSAEKVEKEASSELKGLTIDETKTKVGKDFYDLFYIKYSQIPNKSNSTITVTELPTRGTSSQIHIVMEDSIVYSFPTNPSDEYLAEQVEYTFQYINNFNAQKKFVRNEFMY